MKDIFLLGIETSCDETAAAIVKNGRSVCSNIIASQIETHQEFGGVVPEIASRKHVENISHVVDSAMAGAGLRFEDLDGVACTYGPGLVGALLVGLSYAKALSFGIKKPFFGVNHIEAHIAANYLENSCFEPPFMCLVVSGGHTHLLLVKDFCEYTVLGRTRDDAAGEAYDKVARAMGLGYPGGPIIDRLAKEGDPNAIHFPRANLDNIYDFSFSGLKSAVLNHINKCNMQGLAINKKDLAASFQDAVVDVLVKKTILACKELQVNKIALAGGVSSNSGLRMAMKKACDQEGYFLNMPNSIFCTDNAAMVSARAHFDFLKGKTDSLSLNAFPDLRL